MERAHPPKSSERAESHWWGNIGQQGNRYWGLLSLLLLACETPQQGLNWAVRFACQEQGDETGRVSLRIARGQCPAGSDVVYETTVSRSEPIPMHAPDNLAPGEYALSGVAYDASGNVVAEGCSNTMLPTQEPIDLLLLGAGNTPCLQPPPGGDDGGGVSANTGSRDSGIDGGSTNGGSTNGGSTNGGSTNGGPTTGAWTARSDLPQALGCLTSAVLSDGVHVLGGSADFSGSLRVQKHYLYNAGSNSWSASPADVPDTNSWCTQAHAYNDKLYLTGGWPDGDRLFRVYDPIGNSWQSLPALPDNFSYGYASAVAGDFLYLIGGRDQATASGNGYKYSFASQAWSSLAPIPHNEGSGALAAAVWEGRVYVLNGGAGSTAILQIYTIATNAWSSGPSLAGYHEGAAAAAMGGRVYFFGGVKSVYSPSGAASTAVDIYNIGDGSWSKGSAMGDGRFRLSAVSVGDAIYVSGGFLSDTRPTAVFDVYRP